MYNGRGLFQLCTCTEGFECLRHGLELRRGLFLSFSLSDTPHYENVPFEVPDNWAWTNIEELFFVTKLAGFEYTDYLTKDVISINNEVPIVRAQNVRMGYFVENANEAISEALSQQLERSALTKKCLLMTFIGAGIGDTCIFPALKRCHLAPNVAKIEPYSDRIDLKYALYYLMSDLGQLGVRGISKSTAQPSLSMATIRRLEVALPPFAEQHRIVAEIEKWISLIDIIEIGEDELQSTIKQAKNKILDLAIHGKLVPQDPNDEPAIELLKRINPDFTPCDNGHYTQLPNGWCECQLENIVKYEQPQAYIVKSTDYDDKYLIPVLTAGKSFIIGYTNETEGIYQNTPCIIFDDFTTDSKLVDFPFKVKSSAMKILRVADSIEIEYVAMFMNITRLIGDTHKRYWISEYSKLCIPIPPKEEQKRIANAVNVMFKKLNTIMENL